MTTGARSGRRGFLTALLSAIGGFIAGRLLPRKPTQISDDLGEAYHEWSSLGGIELGSVLQDWGRQPERTKTYPDAPQIALPDPPQIEVSLGTAIERRRSQRSYAPGALPLEALSALLHAAAGITDALHELRAAPSAGALYPLETYVVAHDVAGLGPGSYHYGVRVHSLAQLRAGDLRAELLDAGLGQEMLDRAQACIVLSAIWQRTRWRYQARTYRYVMLEAGHAAQNVYLAATGLGLGTCAVGAFYDDRMNALLGLDGRDEAVIYLLPVGIVT